MARTDADIHSLATDYLKGAPANTGYTPFTIPAYGAVYEGDSLSTSSPAKRVSAKTQNLVGRPIFMSFGAAVISQPGQNGHLYLQVAASNGTSTAPADAWFVNIGNLACRNNSANTGEFATGGQLSAIIPVGGWYRIYTEAIVGYTEPTYVYMGTGRLIAL